MAKKTVRDRDPQKKLRTLTEDELKSAAGGIKGKPGQYTSSSGGGGAG